MSPCATREQLERFLCDGPDAGDREAITEHLEGCPVCVALLDELTHATPDERPRATDPEAAAGDARLLEDLKAAGPRRGDLETPEQRGSDGTGDGHSSLGTEINSAAARARIDRGGRAHPVFDGFRIIREIGRGGMGVVYEAEEERLSRRVALKILPASLLMQPKQVQRFEREARAAARLHHTNIVPVFGVGEQGGHHYYFMQYIEGKSLAAVLDELERERVKRAELGLAPGRLGFAQSIPAQRLPASGPDRIAGGRGSRPRPSPGRLASRHQAVEPARGRERRRVGRRLRPGENAGRPTTLTSAGELLGTIRYMAPERFAGCCDERSDLYGLGITLYELAARRPAYDAVDRYALIDESRQKDLVALGKRAPGIPRDLETIIHKATDREPNRRYQSASALAEDLRRFLDDRPIRARQPSAPERIVRWCRRNRWASAFLLALGLGVIASGWQAIRADLRRARSPPCRGHGPQRT